MTTINDFIEKHEKVVKNPLERDNNKIHDCLGRECYKNWLKI
jgi:hypothetical protein